MPDSPGATHQGPGRRDADAPDTPEDLATRTRSGPGRVLVALYAVFAVAATSRTVVQVVDRFEVAPLAFTLSGLAALVYVLATVCLARGSRGSRRLATASLVLELVGVLVVGSLSWVVPQWFPEPTVWSHLGQGYLFIPLVLPVLGLWWLRHTRPGR